ncbi:MAG: lamin tail domain-containing protein [Planctomycetota bacterium]
MPSERTYSAQIPLVINEFMASNSSSARDPQGEYDDWIEIHNYGSDAIDVGGFYLTDDLSNSTKWRIPDNNPTATTIGAGGYLLIWADNDTAYSGLHANFKLDAGGEEIGLFDVDGSTLIDSIVFPDQTTDISYGCYPDANKDRRFFALASPGRQNIATYPGQVADTKFSHNRGFYNSPFSVTIATETKGAVIYYTIDGSEPYIVSGRTAGSMVYNAPIPIYSTTCLRAVAVKPGWKSSNVDCHTYIILHDVIRQTQQEALLAGYPSEWWGGYPADYGMDPEVYNDPDYSDLMDDALLSIPTVSLVTNQDNLFSHENDPEHGGIYIYTGHSITGGRGWERPVSAEFFTNEGLKEFQVNCGLRIQGGENRRPNKCPKHSFSLRFRNEYGPNKLNFKLFDDWPVNSFNTIQFRGVFNNAWTHWSPAQRARTQYIRDQWMRDCLSDMDYQDAGQGFFVHLYLNGIYWGVYNLQERPVASHYAAYNGGDEENIDAINGGRATDGTTGAWNQMKNVVASRNWEEICKLLNIDNFIDWTLANLAVSNRDLKNNGNWRAAGGGTQRRPWHFYSWDAEHIIEGISQSGTTPSDDPTGLFNYLDDIEEFKVRFGDRVHKHLFNGGALTPQKNIQRWLKRADELDVAVIAESARWGDYRRDMHSYSSGPYYLYTRNDFWIPEKNRLINDYFPRRTAIALNQFRSRGLYPRIDAPEFRINGSYQHGGQTGPEDVLSMTTSTGIIYYSLDGSDPRPSGARQRANTTTLIAEHTAKRTLVPTGNISSNWRGGGVFDDSGWRFSTGNPGGIGYERNSGYQDLIKLDLEDQMYTKNATCYIRIPFIFNDNSDDFGFLTLKMRYDDGFIAYLNGVEVARSNFTGTPRWNSSANGSRSDSLAVNLENIDISAYLSSLKTGVNILAIHGLNTSTTSSDFLISAELVAVESSSPGDGGTSVGAQQYNGPIMLNNSVHVKSRVLSNGVWSALNEATFAVGPVAENLRITEIMYNPNDPNTEYVELQNVGGKTVNLNLVTFTNGIDYIFPNLELASNEYVVVVQDREAFETRYGAGLNIAGEYSGKLNNAGERIRLEDAIGQTILDFDFKDGWRSITDGDGFSLTVIDPVNTDPYRWNEKDSWRASAYLSGSPGEDDGGIVPEPGAVVINEVLAHSHAEAVDWIELHNTTDTAIDIGGWFLSDSSSDLAKYRIAQETIIAQGGYIVFYEDQHFNNPSDPGSNQPFALSENGERLYLSSAESNLLTGYRNVEDFGGSETGVSFGRYYKPSTGNYNFVPMSENSPGSANAYPKVGPIVINEIMYNPSWPVGGSYTNDQYEYVELHNISSEPVSLYDFDTAQPWKFTDGIDFTFPADVPVTIPASGYLLVVKDPEAFSWRYPAVPVEKILGPYNSSLNNAGERLELSMPGDIDEFGTRYYIRIDRVTYSDGSHPENSPDGIDHWPTEPDGGGESLTRKVSSDYGNDPDNWEAAIPSSGLDNL